MKNNDLDQILQQALSPIEPDKNLNTKIRLKMEEKNMLKVNKKLSIKVATLVATITICLGSITAFAAWKYLSLDAVAEKLNDYNLSSAFNSSNSIKINETQKYGDYKITFLGVISGENLSDSLSKDDKGNINSDRTYAVVAIENADGTPMPSSTDPNYGKTPFFVSPLISGQNPSEYNIITMNGGYSEFVNNGILYRIAECDNVEVFADHDLYLCVSSTSFYDNKAYNYDKQTGKVTRNNNYQGVNALFNLPLDKSKGNKDAADAYLKKLETSWKEDSTDTTDILADSWGTWDEQRLSTDATLDKNSVQTLTPDKDGNIHYFYNNGSTQIDSIILVDALFEKDQFGMSSCMHLSGSEDLEQIQTFTRNKDKTITVAIYNPK